MFATRRHPAKSITLDLRPQYNTIDVEHDFLGATTEDLPLRFNGEQIFWLFYNPNDTKHYSTVAIGEGVSGTFEFTDENGDSRVSQSSTSLVQPITPVGSRDRWCSPDVEPGNGNLNSPGNPGSLQDAADGELSGDRVNLGEGSPPKPYSINDITFSATNITLIAKPGETPIISGASTVTITWRDDTGTNAGIYSTTDFDVNTKQVHALINSVMERQTEWDTLAELASADHGWAIDTGRLHIKLSSSPTSFITIDPSTVEVVLPKNNSVQITASADGFWCEDVIVEFVGGGTGSNPRGIRASADNVVFRNVTLRHIQQQGAFVGSTDGFLAENCTVEDNNQYITWDRMKNSPSSTEVSSKIHMSGVTNGTVRNSTFNGSPDCLAAKDTSGVCRNINIYNNVVTRCKDEGIDINSEGTQIKRWGNELDRSFHLASFAPNRIGPFWMINDKCHGGGYMAPQDVAGPPGTFTNQIFKFGGTPTGSMGLFIGIGNTFESIENAAADYNNSYGWNMASADASTRTYLRNNIIITRGKPFRDLSVEPDNVYDIDYNLYWNPAGDEYSYGSFLFHWRNAVGSPTFAGFQSDSGQEDNGEYSDPVLDVNKIPTTPIPGQRIPGITGNAIFGSLEAVKGAQ